MTTIKLRTLFPLLLFGVCAVSAQSASILEVRDNLDRIPIIYPESYEMDVYEMQKNWYLQNYAEIDCEADLRSTVEATDEEIIDRLSKLPTVIEMPFNSVVRSHIKMYSERKKQLVENMLGMSLYYMPIFEEALERHNMPLELKYLPVIESALNPNAVSRAGAAGLWQFMIPTARGEGLEVSSLVDQRRDPYASSDAAARYLKKLYETYGDWSLAIAAYNCGPGNVNKAMRRIPGDGKKDFWMIYPNLPAETRGYVPAFIAANYVMNYYGEHNISPALARKPIVTDTVLVNERIHFKQISEVLDIPMDELKALNPQYREEIIPGNIRPYSLVLPSLQVYAFIANVDSIKGYEARKYVRRGTVDPGTYRGYDNRGEYVEVVSVTVHKVGKGETLSKVAKKYGVTESSIRETNKIGKKLKRGQKLNITKVKRTYVNKNVEQITDSIAYQSPDSVVVADTLVADGDDIQQQRVSDAFDNSATSSKKSKNPTTHKVTKGESLGKIAEKYGVTIDAIRNANDISGNKIYPGQKLTIPTNGVDMQKQGKPSKKSKNPTTHKVMKGESLGKIAEKYGVTINAIRRANDISGNKIYPGQKLTIPTK